MDAITVKGNLVCKSEDFMGYLQILQELGELAKLKYVLTKFDFVKQSW